MKLLGYLGDRKIYFIGHGLSTVLLIVFLNVLGLNLSAILFITLFMVFGHVIYLSHDYLRRHRFYKKMFENFELIDKKYLITEFIDTPNFNEGVLVESIISETNKCVSDEIAQYKQANKTYQEYIETWVHEIKTPLAASHLMIENNPTDVHKQLKSELLKVEDYVEQVLYYAKSQHLEKDYMIKEVNLNDMINETLRKYSKMLISKRCELHIDFEDIMVFTDYKWTVFVLGQIIKNSIQYSNQPMYLSFKVKVYNHQVVLEIADKGIGIPEDEISRIFKKGFVGTTGRLRNTSTGIGLYLCQKLCLKMGLQIKLTSEVDKGTKVQINFPKHDLHAG